MNFLTLHAKLLSALLSTKNIRTLRHHLRLKYTESVTVMKNTLRFHHDSYGAANIYNTFYLLYTVACRNKGCLYNFPRPLVQTLYNGFGPSPIRQMVAFHAVSDIIFPTIYEIPFMLFRPDTKGNTQGMECIVSGCLSIAC